jgi:ribosomal protein S18 acetylase RimI-like enzyme
LASLKELELNEASWWAFWADLSWTGADSYVLTSRESDEYFFNRGGFLGCEGGAASVAGAEAALVRAGRNPCFSVPDECAQVLRALTSRGYTAFDSMAVLELGRPTFRTSPALAISSGQEVEPADWAAAYSLSFYGDLSESEAATRVASRVAREQSVTLIEGKIDGDAAGVLAAFRSPGLIGIYCVGTAGGFRRAGVAGSLIRAAWDIASAEGRSLVLQTILSENALGFYSRGGFRRLHSKTLLARGSGGTGGKQAGRGPP